MIVRESGTDYSKPKGEKLRAGGQAVGTKAASGRKETIELDSFSWGNTGTRKKPATKRQAR